MVIFHGGCISCKRKCNKPICLECCYSEFDWSKPSQNPDDKLKVDLKQQRLKQLRGKRSALEVIKTLIGR